MIISVFYFFQILWASEVLISQTSSPEIVRLDGSSIKFSEVDKLVKEVMAEAKVTGIQIAIINDSQIKYLKSFGWKDAKKTTLIDPYTSFKAASFSKSMFAYIVMKLVEEGKFDLDKPLHQYLSTPLYELKNYRFDYKDLANDERHKKITGRMLLTHTSGFPNYRFFTPDEKLIFEFEPGTNYGYSGEGIILLQTVIEHVTGQGLLELSLKYLIRPFNMSNTSYVWQPSFVNNFAVGFDSKEQPHQRGMRQSADAAGSAETTITDFSNFIVALLNDPKLDTKLLEEMLSPQFRIRTKRQFGPDKLTITTENGKINLSYGLGWGVFDSPYGSAFFKEGHDQGFQNYSVVFREKGIGLIIMTNSDNGESAYQELHEKIIGNTFSPWSWENYVPYSRK